MKWFIGNLDGDRQGLVIANSWKRAAEIAGTSVYDMQLYWHRHTTNCPIGLERETLYVRPFARYAEWEKARRQ